MGCCRCRRWRERGQCGQYGQERGAAAIRHVRTLIEAHQALAVYAPLARGAIDMAAQGPSRADFFNGDAAAEFSGKLFGPHAGRALALEEFLTVINHGGIEYGHGEYSHG